MGAQADKIGDAVSFGNGEFLVLERDDDSVPDDSPALIEKKIYRFNLDGATDVSDLTGTVGTTGKTIDELTVDEMLANNIQPIEKTLHVDLNAVATTRFRRSKASRGSIRGRSRSPTIMTSASPASS